jgi:MFS family permease
MITLGHPYRHFRQYGGKHNPLYVVSVMLLFWSVVEGMISFISPIVVVQAGLSKTMMGFVLSSSSVAGALFDFLLSKYLQNTHFRRVFLLMFIVTAAQPLILWQAKTVPIFIIAMSMWGIFYDFMSFATFDFVGRKTEEGEHCSAFGVISIFRSVGYLIAPLIAGLVITELVDWKIYTLEWVFLALAYIFYLLLIVMIKKDKNEYITVKVHKPLRLLSELSLWTKVGKLILPVLIFSVLLFTIDNFIWTIGPLLSEGYQNIRPFGGILLTLYTIPTFFVGWFVGSITNKFGKKKSGMIALLAGSMVLACFALVQSAWLILGIIFVSSTLISFSWPAMRGTYADYISESPKFEKEITALEDFAGNIGYIIGPIFAGALADVLGNAQAFSALGIICVLVSLVLLKVTPRKIQVKVNESEIKEGYVDSR